MAAGAVPDVLAPGLRVVFCGINPGRVSAAAGAAFANPRNDFWRLLHEAGFTPRLLEPHEQFELLRFGIGLTNAARRTTRGSSDLRAADFAGARERLEELATSLEPGTIGFVGKAAFQGVFRERAEHGLQRRRLVETALFVLPSTSPANAAVRWEERLRWFRLLHDLVGGGGRIRSATRALVLDEADRVLLVRMGEGERALWVTPGGGVEEGESDAEAIRRELLEETGLEEYQLGPHVWTRTAPLRSDRWDAETERMYLVRVPAFEPQPHFDEEALRAEGVTAVRWWALDELEEAAEPCAPRRLALLTRELILHGPPAEPIDVGL